MPDTAGQPGFAEDLYFEADDAQDIAPAPKPVPPPPPPAPPAPRHDPRTVRLAAQYGITGDQLNEYSPRELDRIVDSLVERTHAREEALFQAVSQQRAAQQQPARQPEPPPPPSDPLDFEEIWDEPTNKVMRAMAQRIKDQDRRLQELGHVAQSVQRAEQQTYQDAADEAFESLGPTFDGLFDAATPDGLARCKAVWDAAAKSLAAGQTPSRKQWKGLIEKTARQLFGPRATAAAPVPAAPQSDGPPTPGGYGGRAAGVNGTHAPAPAPAPASEPERAVRPKRPDGTWMSDAEIAEQEEAAERERYLSGLTERPTARKTPSLKGRAAEIEALKEYRAKEFQAGAPDDEFDTDGNFIP